MITLEDIAGINDKYEGKAVALALWNERIREDVTGMVCHVEGDAETSRQLWQGIPGVVFMSDSKEASPE
jgi:hypothetical protein